MARDEPGRDTAGPAAQTASTDERNDTSLMGRRSYLKLAGATAAAASVGTGAVSAAENDYEVIEARGQTVTIDSGQTWENKLIDLGNGNTITIIAKGTNWTVRNIGFRGTLGATGTAPNSGTVFGIADTGDGTSTLENIFWGRGNPDRPSNERPLMMWVDPDHSGHLDVKNVHFGHAGCNGIYGSAPAYNGNGGTIHIDSCYAYDNHHTAFRIGDNGCKITDSVIYKSGTRAANRGIWVWSGNYGGGATIENTHVITNGAGGSIVTHNSPSIDMDHVYTDDGTGTHSGPEHFVPDGCPESPEAAASGGNTPSSGSSSADGSTESLENTLLVDGVGTSGGTRYEFTVSGAAEKATIKGATIDDGDSIESGHITGSVAGWRDSFRFAGDLEELTVDGDARVFINGEEVDLADYGQEKPHVLALVGNGTTANYEISVDGAIETISGDESAAHATVSSGNTVEGSIERAAQRFRFSGTLTDITFLDGSAQVYVDDQRIDPKQYNEQELLPHAIVIDGTDTDGRTEYAFSVDGEVITSSYRDASVNPGDEIDGRSVSGKVDDGLDAYWFDGDIADFQLSGNANVDIEYNARSN